MVHGNLLALSFSIDNFFQYHVLLLRNVALFIGACFFLMLRKLEIFHKASM